MDHCYSHAATKAPVVRNDSQGLQGQDVQPFVEKTPTRKKQDTNKCSPRQQKSMSPQKKTNSLPKVKFSTVGDGKSLNLGWKVNNRKSTSPIGSGKPVGARSKNSDEAESLPDITNDWEIIMKSLNESGNTEGVQSIVLSDSKDKRSLEMEKSKSNLNGDTSDSELKEQEDCEKNAAAIKPQESCKKIIGNNAIMAPVIENNSTDDEADADKSRNLLLGVSGDGTLMPFVETVCADKCDEVIETESIIEAENILEKSDKAKVESSVAVPLSPPKVFLRVRSTEFLKGNHVNNSLIDNNVSPTASSSKRQKEFGVNQLTTVSGDECEDLEEKRRPVEHHLKNPHDSNASSDSVMKDAAAIASREFKFCELDNLGAELGKLVGFVKPDVSTYVLAHDNDSSSALFLDWFKDEDLDSDFVGFPNSEEVVNVGNICFKRNNVANKSAESWHNVLVREQISEEKIMTLPPHSLSMGNSSCEICSLRFATADDWHQHMREGHWVRFMCSLSHGLCQDSLGAVSYHSHLWTQHLPVIDMVRRDLLIDLKGDALVSATFFHGHGQPKVASTRPCCVCLLIFEIRTELLLHELFVHGIPARLFSIGNFAISPIIDGLWWTGKGVAWVCGSCPHKDGSSSLLHCPVHLFPKMVANHSMNVHLTPHTLIAGWYLLLQLVIHLPPTPRHAMGSQLIVGVCSDRSLAKCSFCFRQLSHFKHQPKSRSQGACVRCETLIRANPLSCWHRCNFCSTGQDGLLHHMITSHMQRAPSGWCVRCGQWAVSLYNHARTHTQSHSTFIGADFCRFCQTDLSGMDSMECILHSLFVHVFVCPVMNCNSLATTSRNHHSAVKNICVLPTRELLVTHLHNCHAMLNLPGRMSHLDWVLHSQGGLLSKTGMAGLDSTWHDAQGASFVLNGDELVPLERVQRSLVCVLCRCVAWVAVQREDVCHTSALCIKCTSRLNRAAVGPPWLCPVSFCVFEQVRQNAVLAHLDEMHHSDFSKFTVNNVCKLCGPTGASLKNISFVHHYIEHHAIACLVCLFIASSLEELITHWRSYHGVTSAENAWSLLTSDEIGKQVAVKGGAENPKWEIFVVGTSSVDSVFAVLDPMGKVQGHTIREGDLNGGLSMEESPIFEPIDNRDVSKEHEDDIASVKVEAESGDEEDAASEKGGDGEGSDSEQMDVNLLAPSMTMYEDEAAEESDSEPALQIDTTVASPCSSPPLSPNPLLLPSDNANASLMENSTFVRSNINFIVNGRHGEALNLVTDSTADNVINATPTFGLMEELNSAVVETIASMGGIIPPPDNSLKGLKGILKKSRAKSAKLVKGLGEDAFIDEVDMATNILQDLHDRFIGQCVECGVSVILRRLDMHLTQSHPDAVVHCGCGGFSGPLGLFLIHSFHMTHMPNEARPFSVASQNRHSLIVLEARPIRTTGSALVHPCYKCGKRFKLEKSRMLHYNLCKLEKKLTCDLCGEKFARDYHLTKHKEWKHNPQTCHHCGKAFTSEVSLTQHVLHIHKKQLAHKCTNCGEAFAKSSQLRVHFRLHTGIKPYVCGVCYEKFVSRGLLKKHSVAKRHNGPSGTASDSSEDLKHYKSKKRHDRGSLNVSHSDSESNTDSGEDVLENKLSHLEPESAEDRATEQEFQTRLQMLAMTESDLDSSESEKGSTKQVVGKKRKKRVVKAHAPKTANIPASCGIQKKSSNSSPIDIKPVNALIRADLLPTFEAAIGAENRCTPCQQSWDSISGKLLHLYLIHPQLVLDMGLQECGFCQPSRTFTTADDVCEHHLLEHQRVPAIDGRFRCLCNIEFREEGAFYFHLYYAHRAQRALTAGGEIICRVCSGSQPRPRLNKIVDLVVHLSDQHQMFDHVRVNESFMCNFCYKAFESWTVLSLHFFMVHKATKSQTLSYDCPYCQGASPWHSIEALQYHLDNVHPGHGQSAQPLPEHSLSIYTPAGSSSVPPHTPTTTTTTVYASTKKRKRKLCLSQPANSLEAPGSSSTLSKADAPPKKRKMKESSSQPTKISSLVPFAGIPLIKKCKPPLPSDDRVADETLYCICQCPYDDVSDMIGCDNENCRNQWFHFECVGIMAAPEGTWFCPDCLLNIQRKPKLKQPSQDRPQADLLDYYDRTYQSRGTVRRLSASSSSSSSSSSSGSSTGSKSSSSSSDSE